jgi:hypothetical protein
MSEENAEPKCRCEGCGQPDERRNPEMKGGDGKWDELEAESTV